MIETQIRIVEAEKLGAHPRLLFGRFNSANELVYALTGDGKSWSRERNESAELFCERITRDLAEAANYSCPALVASA